MRIGLVADDFTRHCLELEPDLDVINLKKQSYPVQVLINGVDVLLVESAWLGYQGSWKRHIASYESDNNYIDHILWLTKLCKLKGIPTIFWNKEDPVSFSRFKSQVEKFDVVLTTDESMVLRYKKETKAKKIIQQSFFFQPLIHNPTVEKTLDDYANSILFCGGYYESEYPDRAQRLTWGVEGVGKDNVVIFDRFNGAKSGWSSFEGVSIKPSFEYIESKEYYQSGLAHINVNSIDGLKTMFSRRMLELIACNQKVIDLTNYKKKSLLSEFVIQVSNAEEAREALRQEKPKIDHQYLKETYSVNAFMKKLKRNI